MRKNHYLHDLYSQTNSAHELFLKLRKGGLKELGSLIDDQISVLDPSTINIPSAKNELLDENAIPDTLPFTPHHMNEFVVGSIAKCFGEEYQIYDCEGRHFPRIPNGALQLISRVLKIDGKRHDFKSVASILSQYDVPHDAWYFTQNSHPGEMPYSIIMEIALQTCGFLAMYLGTPLLKPEQNFFYRNLDGVGTLVRRLDLRGKIIENNARLISTTVSGNTILQKFEFELSADKKVFYKGSTVFGCFLLEALKNQLGLDNGKILPPWHEENNITNRVTKKLCLSSKECQEQFYSEKSDKPYYRLSGGQLEFLDEVITVENGGKAGMGYVYANKRINPTDWFYSCHFKDDPVMPGSMGVEAIIEALKIFVINSNLGAEFTSPYFTNGVGSISWKYRAQIVQTNKQMSLEVHIKAIERNSNSIKVIADANLRSDGLRIYEIKDVSVEITDSGASL